MSEVPRHLKYIIMPDVWCKLTPKLRELIIEKVPRKPEIWGVHRDIDNFKLARYLKIEDEAETLRRHGMKGSSLTSGGETYSKTNGVSAKIGKVFRKLGIENAQDLEAITACFSQEDFHIISGETIREAYYGDNYTRYQNSSLHDSCMRGEIHQKFMDFYVDNLEMVVSYDDDEKITSRALLWRDIEITTGSRKGEKITFLDRIYGNTMTQQACKKWANAKGFYCKNAQNYSSPEEFNNPEGECMSISLKYALPTELKYYPYMPYMDTMKWCYKGFFKNYSHSSRIYKMTSTSGGSPFNECPTCKKINLQEPHSVPQKRVCPDCRTSCSICGKETSKDIVFEGEPICARCYSSEMSTCTTCGVVMRDEDAVVREGQIYCRAHALTDGEVTYSWVNHSEVYNAVVEASTRISAGIPEGGN